VQAKDEALVATENALSELQLIEVNAEVITTVRMAHRGDIRHAGRQFQSGRSGS
jgi:hypothetical protein